LAMGEWFQNLSHHLHIEPPHFDTHLNEAIIQYCHLPATSKEHCR
jgi:hypothetical protein